jgi:hypothetical protein
MQWLTPDDLRDWKALYIIESSDQNPEVTEWDDDDGITRKLERAAAMNLKK